MLLKKWLLYKKNIIFIESGGLEENVIDFKDVLYVKLYMVIGYLVFMWDLYILKMGVKVVGVEIIVFVKNYVWSVVIEYMIKVGYLGVFLVIGSIIGVVVKFIWEVLG